MRLQESDAVAQGVGDIVVLLDPDCTMIAPMNM